MVTRTNLKYDITNWWNWRFDSVLGRMNMPLVTTSAAAGSSKLTLVDTVLGRGTVGANDYDGREIEIMETTTGSPAVGEAAAVDQGGFDQTSTLTFSPAMSDEVQSGIDYMLMERSLSAEKLNAAINAVLRGTHGPHLWFPSMCPDGDLEGGTVGDWWGDIGADTPGTREYATTSTNEWIVQQLFGGQSLHIVESGADGGVKSDVFYVGDTDQLLARFYVQALVGTLTVVMYDETNSADIGTAVSIDEPGWKEVRFSESVPAACESVSVRFKGSANNDEYYVSAPIIVQSRRGHAYTAPSWFVSKSQYRQAIELPQGVASEDDASYIALSKAFRAAAYEPKFLTEARGVNPLHIWARADTAPIALEVQRPFAELSTNAATTACDREYVMWKVIANLLRADDNADWRNFNRTAMARARAMGYGVRETRVRENETMVV